MLASISQGNKQMTEPFDSSPVRWASGIPPIQHPGRPLITQSSPILWSILLGPLHVYGLDGNFSLRRFLLLPRQNLGLSSPRFPLSFAS